MQIAPPFEVYLQRRIETVFVLYYLEIAVILAPVVFVVPSHVVSPPFRGLIPG